MSPTQRQKGTLEPSRKIMRPLPLLTLSSRNILIIEGRSNSKLYETQRSRFASSITLDSELFFRSHPECRRMSWIYSVICNCSEQVARLDMEMKASSYPLFLRSLSCFFGPNHNDFNFEASQVEAKS